MCTRLGGDGIFNVARRCAPRWSMSPLPSQSGKHAGLGVVCRIIESHRVIDPIEFSANEENIFSSPLAQ